MTRPTFEVADVILKYGDAFVSTPGIGITTRHRRVLRKLLRCRTAALGGHARKCARCGRLDDVSYNSCRDSHCPKCGGSRRASWLAERAADLLPVPYFHIVFTLPAELSRLALQNKKEIYSLLFAAAAETLVEVAADPRHLGASIGLFAVLHTWGQSLEHHPHLHCVVPGGGLSQDGTRWVASRKNFFLPVAVLRKVFRGKMLDRLQRAYLRCDLRLFGKLSDLRHDDRWQRYLKPLWKKKWVVYAKPPFGGPLAVLKYVARYTHRVAIANSRLVAVQNGRVDFRWRDYRDGQQKVMTLVAQEFLRRFSLHIQPKGLQRIRHYGLLSNRSRRLNLARCRELIGAAKDEKYSAIPAAPIVEVPEPCPACGHVIFVRIDLTPFDPSAQVAEPISRDTS